MKKYFLISPLVFFPTALLSILFVAIVLYIGAPAQELFSGFQAWMSTHFGWFLTGAINYYLIFVLYLCFSKFGKIRLGGDNAEPEFSTFSWVAMLFSAGMGIGLLYFSVAEPMLHYINPINAEGSSYEKIRQAMDITFFHYGFHVWGIYCLVGLSLAYFCFNKSRPLSLSSTIESLIPSKLSFLNKLVDALASLATLFGLATSLGFGAKQFVAGLNHVFGIANSTTSQVVSIVVITIIATISIITGLKKGVRVLSVFNLRVAALLFLFVLFFGPTIHMLDFVMQSVGSYLNNIISVSMQRGKFGGDASFFTGWSIFYWAWWISWSPFVGTFIARVSRGRTIREFVFFVLLTPTVLSLIWMGVFGGFAFDLQLNNTVDIATIVQQDSSQALFAVLDQLPFTMLISFLAVLLVGTFFVTSSDSGSLVVDYMTSGGKLEAPKAQKIFWASMEGLIAIALIVGGGLSALQAVSISTGFPFSIILILISISLFKALKKESDYMSVFEK